MSHLLYPFVIQVSPFHPNGIFEKKNRLIRITFAAKCLIIMIYKRNYVALFNCNVVCVTFIR